jgi:hypothetical protein
MNHNDASAFCLLPKKLISGKQNRGSLLALFFNSPKKKAQAMQQINTNNQFEFHFK